MGKKSSPPPAPDYSALAIQQAALDKTAADEQTKINRPNQVTPFGNTSWTQDAGGNWTQNTSLNSADQSLLDQQRQFQGQQQSIGSGLLGQAKDSLGKGVDYGAAPAMAGYDSSKLAQPDPNAISSGLGPQGQFDPSKLSEYGSYNPSSLPALSGVDRSSMTQLDPSFGAVEGVRDAMMGRMGPARERARQGEIQRLKNQGLTEDSDAFQRAMTRLDQGDTDAEQQALLGATTEYGNIFNRGLAGNEQNYNQQMGIANLSGAQRAQLSQEQLSAANLANQTRGQQFGEQGAQATLDNQNRDTQFNQNAQVQQMLASLRGQQFGEQGAMAQLSGQQRQQNLAEQEQQRQAPLNDYMKLVQGINPTMPNMPSFMGGSGYQAADMSGAAQAQYQAQMDAYNANQAKSGGLMSGLFGLGGALMGGPAGSLGAKLGTKLFGG